MKVKLSRRLKVVAQYVKPYKHCADIGTDHAYLPIYLVQEGICDMVIASDVKLGPVANAKKNVKRYGYQNYIQVVQSAGIDHIQESTACLTICGMGGRLIREILSQKRLGLLERVVIQSNMAAHLVRSYLCTHGFKISQETVVYEDGNYYEVVCFDRGREEYSADQLFFGPVLLDGMTTVFREMCLDLAQRYQYKLERLPEQAAAKRLDYANLIQRYSYIAKHNI